MDSVTSLNLTGIAGVRPKGSAPLPCMQNRVLMPRCYDFENVHRRRRAEGATGLYLLWAEIYPSISDPEPVKI